MQIIERIAQLLLIYSSEQIEQTGTAIKDISKSNGKFRDSKIIDQINKAMNYYRLDKNELALKEFEIAYTMAADLESEYGNLLAHTITYLDLLVLTKMGHSKNLYEMVMEFDDAIKNKVIKEPPWMSNAYSIGSVAALMQGLTTNQEIYYDVSIYLLKKHTDRIGESIYALMTLIYAKFLLNDWGFVAKTLEEMEESGIEECEQTARLIKCDIPLSYLY